MTAYPLAGGGDPGVREGAQAKANVPMSKRNRGTDPQAARFASSPTGGHRPISEQHVGPHPTRAKGRGAAAESP